MSPPLERMESARTACFSESECIRLSRCSRQDTYFKAFTTGSTEEHRGTQGESVLPCFLCAPCGKEVDLLAALAKPALFRHNTRRTLVPKSYSPPPKNLPRPFLHSPHPP